MAKVKCACCGKELDYTKEQAVRSLKNKRRYSHLECEPGGELVPLPPPKEKKEKPKTPETEILDFCNNIFGDKTNYAMIKKQIKSFKKDYNYTESGILKTLDYIYNIKKMSIDKSNGTIGIVPYIYPEAYQYYLNLYQTEQANKQLNIAETASKTVTIKLKFKELKKHLFNIEEE